MTSASIYKITNMVNGKYYIGSSVNLKGRWNHHKSELRNNQHHSRYLQNAWNKYGEESFVFELCEICDASQKLVREQVYLDTLKPAYNVSPLATGGSGFTLSNEAKEKIRKKATGRPVSEETRKKISEALKGRKLSDTHKAKIKANTPGFSGKIHTEESRQKISQAIKLKNASIIASDKPGLS